MENTRSPSEIVAFDVYRLEVWPDRLKRLKLIFKGKEVRVARKRGARPLPLGERLLSVLHYLASNASNREDRIFAEDDILTDVWGINSPVESNVVEKAIGVIRAALTEASQPIIETIRGTGYRFVPEVSITKTAESGSPTEPVALSTGEKAQGSGPSESFECRRFSSDQAAIGYVIQRCAQVHLKTVRNTFMRFKSQPPRYPRETVDLFMQGLATFLDRHSKRYGEVVCLFEMFGGFPESYYLDKVIAVAKTRRGKIDFHWLRDGTSPIMNFIILEYEDKTAEVLFGWGRHVGDARESVFQSGNEELVEEFCRFFELLRLNEVSNEVTLPELRRKRDELRLAEKAFYQRVSSHHTPQRNKSGR